MNVAEKEEKAPEVALGAMMKEMIADQRIIQLKTVDGRTWHAISVATDLPGQKRSKTATMPYVIPAGYIWHSAKFDTSRAQGDYAYVGKSNGDIHNGDVFLEVKCSGIGGRARAAVDAAWGATPAALQELHDLAEKEENNNN